MTTFAELGVDASLARDLAQQGITEPTPVQAATIPGALDGRDVAAQAPTGSGKTLAFGLPLLMRCGVGAPRRPAGLVLVPTRELATQIVDALTPLAGRDGPSIAAIFGGVGMHPQRARLRKGVDLVVGCPGRIEDLIAQGDLHLGDVRFAVVDEADRMADVGFLPALRRILGATPNNRQTLLFSATLGGPVGQLIDRYQRDPERHDVAALPSQRNLARHLALPIDDTERVHWAAVAVRSTGPSIVFCRTRHRADRVARQLSRQGVEALPIHGGRSQNQRTAALRALHEGRIQALVATDVAARGIHVDDLACVVHFDAPEDQETYVHRSGRTGRAGSSGVVLNFVDAADVRSGSLRRSPAPKGVEVTVTSVESLAADLGGDPAAAPARRKVETVASVATSTGARRTSSRGPRARGRRTTAGSSDGASTGSQPNRSNGSRRNSSTSSGGGSRPGSGGRKQGSRGSGSHNSNGGGSNGRGSDGRSSNGRGAPGRGSRGSGSSGGGSKGGSSPRGRQRSGGGSNSGRRG